MAELKAIERQMSNNVTEYKSKKSNSTYTVSMQGDRAYVGVTGEAATNGKVIAEINRIRRGGCDRATAEWTARMLANTY